MLKRRNRPISLLMFITLLTILTDCQQPIEPQIEMSPNQVNAYWHLILSKLAKNPVMTIDFTNIKTQKEKDELHTEIIERTEGKKFFNYGIAYTTDDGNKGLWYPSEIKPDGTINYDSYSLRKYAMQYLSLGINPFLTKKGLFILSKDISVYRDISLSKYVGKLNKGTVVCSQRPPPEVGA